MKKKKSQKHNWNKCQARLDKTIEEIVNTIKRIKKKGKKVRSLVEPIHIQLSNKKSKHATKRIESKNLEYSTHRNPPPWETFENKDLEQKPESNHGNGL